jgi:hypothetical protein
MSRALTLVDRQQLRQYYGARRGHCDGWEQEFDRLSAAALDKLARQRQADIAATAELDAEIIRLWPSFDPVDAEHFDGLLEQRRNIPARVLNLEIMEVEKARQAQREEELREKQKEFAERSQEYVARPRIEHRINYRPDAVLWDVGWGQPGSPEDNSRFFGIR